MIPLIRKKMQKKGDQMPLGRSARRAKFGLTSAARQNRKKLVNKLLLKNGFKKKRRTDSKRAKGPQEHFVSGSCGMRSVAIGVAKAGFSAKKTYVYPNWRGKEKKVGGETKGGEGTGKKTGVFTSTQINPRRALAVGIEEGQNLRDRPYVWKGGRKD